MRIRAFVWAGLFACWGAAQAAVPLPQLKIDAGQTSVSGVSSGGYMAVQLHVAYSATFKKGVGVVAAMTSGASRTGSARGRAFCGPFRSATSSPASR